MKSIYFVHFTITLCIIFFYAFVYKQLGKDEFGFKDWIDPIYFSVTVMSTGFGDFIPKTTKAKLVVMTQQMLMILTSLTFVTKVSLKQ
jgi:hypothetical protein